MSISDTPPPWYADGLRFGCTRCGKCCSGAPGHVWVSLDECGAIAATLGLPVEQFTQRHVRRIGTRLSLLEKKGGDCEFLVRGQDGLTTCSIHQVRPVQCRTWPFWKSNLESKAAWEDTGKDCPGVNRGKHHSLTVIQAAVDANGDLPL